MSASTSLPSGWRTALIGDVCSLATGGTPKSSEKSYYQGGTIKWLVSGDVHQREIYDCKGRITEAGLKNSNARPLPVGSVIIALNGQGKTRGTVAMLQTEATCNQSLVSINPRNRSNLLPEFLFWNLRGRYEEIRRMTGDDGNDRRGLNMPLIRGIRIPVPPLDEQKRLVAVLDQAFAALDCARANVEANLLDAGAVLDKKLEQVFSGNHLGWKVKRLYEVCAISSPLVDPRHPMYIDAVHVGAGNIASKTGELVELKTSREEGLVSGKFPFDESMVLYSKIRPYLEKVARPQFSGICSADMYPLEPIEGQITRGFLFWLLLSRRFTDYAIEGSARAGMPKVNREHLFEYDAALPAIDEQQRIVANLDALRAEVSRLQSKYERELADLAALRQSLLQAAFSGQLT